MEIGQAETTEVNINTSDQEKSIELMRKLFPINAQIEYIGGRYDKEYKINAKLEGSPFCEGGQEIELKIFVLRSFLEEISMEEDMVVDPFVDLQVLSFLVNGEEISNEIDFLLIRGYREPRNKNPETLLENKQTEGLECNFFKTDNLNLGASANIDEGVIFLNKMRGGDDLASYLHEKGHILRIEDDLGIDEQFVSFKEYSSVFKKIKNQEDLLNLDELVTPEISESFRRVIFEERQADIKSLKFVKQHKNLFPNDPDLSKLKNYYIRTMSTYFRFQKGISRSEVVTIMDFDQDWHY